VTNETQTVRRRMIAVLAAAAAVTAGACATIPSDAEPTVVVEGVPDALVGVDLTTTTTVGTGPTQITELWLVLALEGADPELFICSPVRVQSAADTAAQARIVLERLIELRPARDNECSDILTNAIPPEVEILDTRLDEGILDIDLTGLGEIEAENQRLAVAQIVYTATELPGISQVRFLLDGQQTVVPIGDGTAEPGSGISRSDFPRLAGPTTTTAPPAPVPADPFAGQVPPPG
jgi:hypothetical protein